MAFSSLCALTGICTHRLRSNCSCHHRPCKVDCDMSRVSMSVPGNALFDFSHIALPMSIPPAYHSSNIEDD